MKRYMVFLFLFFIFYFWRNQTGSPDWAIIKPKTKTLRKIISNFVSTTINMTKLKEPQRSCLMENINDNVTVHGLICHTSCESFDY